MLHGPAEPRRRDAGGREQPGNACPPVPSHAAGPVCRAAMVFPKRHDPAVHADHAAHVHKHFDLSIMGMGLEGWILLFVVFAAVQARGAARRGGCCVRLHALRPRARAVRTRVADVRPPGEKASQERLSSRAADTGLCGLQTQGCAAARAAPAALTARPARASAAAAPNRRAPVAQCGGRCLRGHPQRESLLALPATRRRSPRHAAAAAAGLSRRQTACARTER